MLQKASCYARQRGIPFIYISANSGARIGLAEEVKHVFQVAWSEGGSPDKVNIIANNIKFLGTKIVEYIKYKYINIKVQKYKVS